MKVVQVILFVVLSFIGGTLTGTQLGKLCSCSQCTCCAGCIDDMCNCIDCKCCENCTK